jgi:7-keto-8-aminopelargonate synthetase-like enzyme
MQFGENILNWSLNDYLGLANHPAQEKQIPLHNMGSISHGSENDEWSHQILMNN